MQLSTLSRAIIAVTIFVVVTLLLYLFMESGDIPFIIFMIGFGITILVSAFIMIYPGQDEWQELSVIPIKRKR
jgi:hypothetical protein